jgi:hypothetical protein
LPSSTGIVIAHPLPRQIAHRFRLPTFSVGLSTQPQSQSYRKSHELSIVQISEFAKRRSATHPPYFGQGGRIVLRSVLLPMRQPMERNEVIAKLKGARSRIEAARR